MTFLAFTILCIAAVIATGLAYAFSRQAHETADTLRRHRFRQFQCSMWERGQ